MHHLTLFDLDNIPIKQRITLSMLASFVRGGPWAHERNTKGWTKSVVISGRAGKVYDIELTCLKHAVHVANRFISLPLGRERGDCEDTT